MFRSRVRRLNCICRNFSAAIVLMLAGPAMAWAASFIEEDGADAASCQRAREVAEMLHPRLDGRIGEDDRRIALEYVEEHSAYAADASAWNNFAAGASLLGQSGLAAWAGMNATAREWFSLYVSNAGAFLLGAGESQAGFAFLTCAYDMGHRTAYLFEALAAYHHDRGEQAETERWIGRAREAAPNDVIIEIEESVVRTGEPPPPDAPDDLPVVDRCIAELEKHFEHVLAALDKQVMQARQLKWDHADMMSIRPQHFPNTVTLVQVRDARDRATMDRDAFRAMLRASGNAGAFSEAGYRQSRQMFADSALSFCIQTYFQVTEAQLRASVQFGVELVFWADVLGVPPAALARELREIASTSNTVSHTPLRIEVVNDGPVKMTERSRFDDWGAPWATMPVVTYFHQKLEADAALAETLDELRDRSPYPQHLETAARKRWCRAVKPAYQDLWIELDDRYRRVGRRYDQVATRLLYWGVEQVEDARLFAQRYVKHMKGPPEFTVDVVNRSFVNLARFAAPGTAADRLSNIPGFLAEQAAEFRKWEARNANRLESEEASIAQRCEPQTVREALEQLTDEELQALLAELNRRSLDEDLTLETEFRPHCNFSIGALKVSVDHTGRVTSGAGNFEAVFEGDRLVAANVEAGIGHASSIAGPVVGRGNVGVVAGIDTRSGDWNLDVQASTSIGLGVALDDDAEVACYPGSASATVHGRELIRSDIAMEHVRTVLATR